jgi:hypothetical protein
MTGTSETDGVSILVAIGEGFSSLIRDTQGKRGDEESLTALTVWGFEDSKGPEPYEFWPL